MSVGELSEHAGGGIYTYKYKYMCLSSLQDTPGSFLFHHKTIFITVTVDRYSLHDFKFIALLRLQHLWLYQATQTSKKSPELSGVFWVLLSYVMLIALLLENLFLDYILKSTIKDLNVFLQHVLSRYEALVIREIYCSLYITALRHCFP